MAKKMTDPRALFIEELRDTLSAEKMLEKALPKMAKEADDQDLRDGFTHHLEETRAQIENIKKVFEALGQTARAKKCVGMEGIVAEHDEFMSEHEPSPEVKDLFLAGAGSRAEHYEIASYTSLIAMAKVLGEDDCAALLQENLAQEQAQLKKLEASGTRLGQAAAQAAA